MNSIEKILGKILGAVFVVALLFGLSSGAFVALESPDVHVLSEASAQSAQQLPVVSFKTFTGSINTEAQIAASASSTKLVIYDMNVASSGAGVVVFKDGAVGSSTTVMNIYMAANTQYDLAPLFGANGFTLTTNSLTATLAGATLTMTGRFSPQ